MRPLALLAGALLLARPPAFAAEPDFSSPGPYPVGARTVVLVDGSRRDDFAGGPRTLVTEVWYPAAEGARGGSRLRFGDFFGPYRELGSKALKRDLEEIDRDFHTLGVREAEPRAGTWPLLIFSHGNGGFRHQNVFQMDHLASHGYVVAAPDHTGNASLTPLPGQAVGYDRNGRGRSAEDRPKDVRFLIDRFCAGNTPELGWLRAGVDREAIGVLGHSFGGFTAVRVAADEPRIKAVLAMTVALGQPANIPTMVMLGAEDCTVGLAGNLLSRGYFLGLKGPRYLFVLKRGGHFTFTEISVVNPNFGDGIGRGKGRDGREIDFIPVSLAKNLINSYTLAFFECHLRGSKEAAKLLENNLNPAELEWWIADRQVSEHPSMPGKGPAASPPTGRSARF